MVSDKYQKKRHVSNCCTVCVLVAQSCLPLCDPMDCSPPGLSVHWILQARILEWVAISFSEMLYYRNLKKKDYLQLVVEYLRLEGSEKAFQKLKVCLNISYQTFENVWSSWAQETTTIREKAKWKVPLGTLLILNTRFLSFYFIYLFLIYFSWRLITLRYCSGFCHSVIWISHGFTCVPHPEPLSHLPPHGFFLFKKYFASIDLLCSVCF